MSLFNRNASRFPISQSQPQRRSTRTKRSLIRAMNLESLESRQLLSGSPGTQIDPPVDFNGSVQSITPEVAIGTPVAVLGPAYPSESVYVGADFWVELYGYVEDGSGTHQSLDPSVQLKEVTFNGQTIERDDFGSDGWGVIKLTAPTTPGDYTLSYRVIGFDQNFDYTDWSEPVTKTITVLALPKGSIEGTKFEDLNINGVRDAGEPGIAGWTFYLDANDNAQLDPDELSTTTNAQGDYSFTDLPAGQYTVAEIPLAGWGQTSPARQVLFLADFTDANGQPSLEGFTQSPIFDATQGHWALTTRFGSQDGHSSPDSVGPDGSRLAPGDLISPTINLNNAISATLSFNYKLRSDFEYIYPSTGRRLFDSALVFVNDQIVGSNATLRDAISAWTGQRVDLASFLNDGQIQAMFEYYPQFGNTGYEEFGWYIDDVAITVQPEPSLEFLGPSHVMVGAGVATSGTDSGSYRTPIAVPELGPTYPSESVYVGADFWNELYGNVVDGTTHEPTFDADIIEREVTFNGQTFLKDDLSGDNWGVIKLTAPTTPGTYTLSYRARTYDPVSLQITDWSEPVTRDIEVLALPLGSIEGTKFEDLNGNGEREEGEPGIAGWTFYLDANNNNQLDPLELSTTTNAQGDYRFDSLPAGVYTVAEIAPAGWTQTTAGREILSLTDFTSAANFPSLEGFISAPIPGEDYGHWDAVTRFGDEPGHSANSSAGPDPAARSSQGQLIAPALSLMGASSATLSFNYKLLRDYEYLYPSPGRQLYDTALVRVNGQTVLAANGLRDAIGAWTGQRVDLGAFVDNHIQVAFESESFYGNSGFEQIGWYIDDVAIEATLNTIGPSQVTVGAGVTTSSINSGSQRSAVPGLHIGSLDVTPNPIVQVAGLNFRMEALDVTATEGNTINRVEFYLDVNGNNQIDPGVDKLLATDTSSANGWVGKARMTKLPLGTAVLMARAHESTGDWSDAALTAVQVKAPPVAGRLTIKPSPATLGQTLKLTVTGAKDADGTIAALNFYKDNGDGIFDPAVDQQIGQDTSDADGWSLNYIVQSGDHGSMKFFVQALDNDGLYSKPISARATVSAPPTLEAITAATNPVVRGQTVRLTAVGVDDVDGTVQSVEFWRDKNYNSTLETYSDNFLGYATFQGGQWVIDLPTGSAPWKLGSNTILARARDNAGLTSLVRLVTVNVVNA